MGKSNCALPTKRERKLREVLPLSVLFLDHYKATPRRSQRQYSREIIKCTTANQSEGRPAEEHKKTNTENIALKEKQERGTNSNLNCLNIYLRRPIEKVQGLMKPGVSPFICQLTIKHTNNNNTHQPKWFYGLFIYTVKAIWLQNGWSWVLWLAKRKELACARIRNNRLG